MDKQHHIPAPNDHAFPIEFVVLPAFVGTLLWLVAMLSRFAQ